MMALSLCSPRRIMPVSFVRCLTRRTLFLSISVTCSLSIFYSSLTFCKSVFFYFHLSVALLPLKFTSVNSMPMFTIPTVFSKSVLFIVSFVTATCSAKKTTHALTESSSRLRSAKSVYLGPLVSVRSQSLLLLHLVCLWDFRDFGHGTFLKLAMLIHFV